MTNNQDSQLLAMIAGRLDRIERKVDVLQEWTNRHEGQLQAYRPPLVWGFSILGSIVTAYFVTQWIN